MSRRRTVVLVVLAVVLLALAAGVRWISRPERVSGLTIDRVGDALGLEISAAGSSEYRLRGTPMLVVRDVVAREPGAATPLLRADRIYLAVPWSTIRSRGGDLAVQRIELDAPQLDLPALQRWLAKRPPSKRRIPRLSDGLRINDGSIVNDDWRIDGIHAELPSVHPEHPVQARLRGRYLDPPLAVPFDLAVALSRPTAKAGLGAKGIIAIERDSWRMPAIVSLAGPLQIGDDDLRITPVRLGMTARYESGETRQPFTLGLYGPLHFDEATLTLTSAGVALRGDGPIPSLDAYGTLSLGHTLALQLDGMIAQWPNAWPALPSPIRQSSSPLPFALRYLGRPDVSDTTTLELRRDTTRFDGRFRLPAMLEWIGSAATGTPLPPLAGTLTTPRIEISGAQLEGVEIQIEDDTPAP